MSATTREFRGACHCGAVGFVYRAAIAVADWQPRACQCGFCRAHGSITVSDPAGSLAVAARDPQALRKYRFGQRTADFLLCSRCGVYLGAVIASDRGTFGIINARALVSPGEPLPDPVAMTYEGEQVAERLERRLERWTPVTHGA